MGIKIAYYFFGVALTLTVMAILQYGLGFSFSLRGYVVSIIVYTLCTILFRFGGGLSRRRKKHVEPTVDDIRRAGWP